MNIRTDVPHLSRLLADALIHHPDGIAVENESGEIVTYAELARMADRVATRLARWGVGRGDRVGLFLPKSIEAVATIHGVLQAGAAYVPVDPFSPVIRGAGILSDAGVKAAIVAAPFAKALVSAWPGQGPHPRLIVVGEEVEPTDALWVDVIEDDAPSPLAPARVADDPAYILYTSGSTGQPKGATISHANAYAFLDWCEAELGPLDGDRFASHAPFHFDLSVFDLYESARHASPLILIGEALAKDPLRLGAFISDRRIDVWYSAPSILALLADRGGLEKAGRRAPRLVLFAGEVFPITSLRRLRNLWPASTFWNLYGPTETNVCTAFRIPDRIPPEHIEAFPIGRVCSPHVARVVDPSGSDVSPGTIGELWIAGPGVMQGYFGRSELTELAFHCEAGLWWYRTGDLVSDEGEGIFRFHGRRDRMVKKRGYRIELGEVESALYRHDEVDRVAVVATSDDEIGVSIAAFVALKPMCKGSIISMKRHCTRYLPHYMIPDSITFLPALPTTSTDKVDYQGLKEIGT